MRNPRVQRWAVALDEYGCNIQYRPGRTMKVDFLSRIPPESAEAGGDSGPLDEEAGEPPVVDIQATTEVEPLPQPEEPRPSVVGTPSMVAGVPTMAGEEESQLAASVAVDVPTIAGEKESRLAAEVCIVEASTARHNLPEHLVEDLEKHAQQLEADPEQASGLLDLIPKRFGRMQRQDPCLKQWFQALDNGEKLRDFLFEGGRLYHVAKPVKRDQNPRLQLVIPDGMIETILRAFHDSDGHVGVDKTYEKIRERYYWDTMYRDVVYHLQECQCCSQRNMRRKKHPLQSMPIPEAPMQLVGMDMVGPLPTSERGNNYILTMVDHFSMWPEAFPVPDKSAETVARVLLTEIIPRHSCMSTLLTDQGTEFNNQLIALLSANLHIHQIRISPYHPQTNGRTERFHGFLSFVLSKHVGATQRDWDDWVPCALLAYRTCVHETTKFTPFFLLHGRDAVLPMDTLLQPKLRYLGEDYVPTMLQRLHQAYMLAKEHLGEGQKKNKRYYDRNVDTSSFTPGDAVYYYSPDLGKGEARKLRPRWHPYFRVVEKKGEVSYLIRHQPTGLTKVVHANHLRLAYPEGCWNKVYEQPEEVAARKPRGADQTLGRARLVGDHEHEEPETRRQPMRGCRLATPAYYTPDDHAGVPVDTHVTRAKRKRPVEPLDDPKDPDPLIPPWLFSETEPTRKRFKRPRFDEDSKTRQESASNPLVGLAQGPLGRSMDDGGTPSCQAKGAGRRPDVTGQDVTGLRRSERLAAGKAETSSRRGGSLVCKRPCSPSQEGIPEPKVARTAVGDHPEPMESQSHDLGLLEALPRPENNPEPLVGAAQDTEGTGCTERLGPENNPHEGPKRRNKLGTWWRTLACSTKKLMGRQK